MTVSVTLYYVTYNCPFVFLTARFSVCGRAATIPDVHDTDTYHDTIAAIPRVSRYSYACRLYLKLLDYEVHSNTTSYICIEINLVGWGNSIFTLSFHKNNNHLG